ncbi:MAG: hypothetical protein AB1592_11355 [Pseudomonadota bacterium]
MSGRFMNSPTEDTRVAFGVRCVWWDGIANVGRRGNLPACPRCGGPLFEVPDEATWFGGVDQHEANGNPGYRAFIEWQRGKCFPSFLAARAAYETATGERLS